MNRIIQVFSNTDLRNGLDGLLEIARKHKVRVDMLEPGEFLIFINAAKTKMRLFASKDAFLHFRSPSGRINLKMIQYLPKYFNGAKIQWDGALKETLLKSGIKEVTPT